MADIGGEAGAGFAAKAGSAIGAGALWGIFASAFLLIPAIFGSLLGPIFKRVTTSVNTKVNTIGNSDEEEEEDRKPQGKMSKAEKDYQKKLEALETEREEMELAARLEKIRSRQAGRAKTSRQASRPASI